MEKRKEEQAGVELCQDQEVVSDKKKDQEVEYVQSSRGENAHILAPSP